MFKNGKSLIQNIKRKISARIPHQSRCARQLCSAEHPVAALTAHWAVIHYRDCASLTPGEAMGAAAPVRN